MVLVGIGVAAICLAVTGWMLTSGTVTQAGTALLWLSGSLNAVDRNLVGVLGTAFVVLMALALVQSPRLTVLASGTRSRRHSASDRTARRCCCSSPRWR